MIEILNIMMPFLNIFFIYGVIISVIGIINIMGIKKYFLIHLHLIN